MVISQIILCILSAIVVVSVLLQKPADPSMGGAFGQSGGSYSKAMKSRTAEAKLNNITKYGAIAVLLISLVLVVLQRFVK
jgi:protein translocase SecG subunit